MANRLTERTLRNKLPLNSQARTKTARKIRTQRNVMRSVWARQIRTKVERKLRTQHHVDRTIWFGIGMMGTIGLSIAVPTLLGAVFGIWLDKHYPANFSWTLTMLTIGLFIGCLNAWYWMDKEHKQILKELEDTDDE